MNAMTLISRTSASVRCEDFGRDSVPTFSPSEYTDAAADRIRAAEDAMIAGMKPKRGSRQRDPAKNSNATRSNEARQAVFDAISAPMTARVLAKILNQSEANAYLHLRRFEAEGVVGGYVPPRIKGRLQEKIWSRTGAPLPIVPDAGDASRRKGSKTQDEVLALMDGTTDTATLAEATGRDTHVMRQIMRGLERDGLIKRAGHGPKPIKGAAAVLWCRA